MFAVCSNVPITNEIKLIIINHESLQNVVRDMLSVHVWQISILEALSCLTRASPNSLWTWLWAEVPARMPKHRLLTSQGTRLGP